MDREAFAKRKRLCAEYLSRIARATSEKRPELMAEWAEKLYKPQAGRGMNLVKSLSDIPPLLVDLRLYYSGTVVPLLAEARPNDFESEAIRLAIAGQESECLATIILRLPAEAATEENSSRAAKGAPVGSEDPIAAKRRAQVDQYIDEVFRTKKKRIFRSDIWKAAGYGDATAFERWQRNDPRTSTQHERSFTRVLTERLQLK
jgi:hypothetical protein